MTGKKNSKEGESDWRRTAKFKRNIPGDRESYDKLLEKRRIQRKEITHVKIWDFDSLDEEYEKEKPLLKELREKEIVELLEEDRLLEEQNKLRNLENSKKEKENNEKPDEEKDEDEDKSKKKRKHKKKKNKEKEKKKKKSKKSKHSKKNKKKQESDTSSVSSEDSVLDVPYLENPNEGPKPDPDAIIGPVPWRIEGLNHQKNNYGGSLLPGEGSAMAQYIQSGKRIPRRGEVGLSSDQIERYEDLGYVMSGSRHKRMTAVRLRKENQVYTAEEKRALAVFNYEQKIKKEHTLMEEMSSLLDTQLKKNTTNSKK